MRRGRPIGRGWIDWSEWYIGYAARMEGKPRSDNPWATWQNKRRRWDRGWCFCDGRLRRGLAP